MENNYSPFHEFGVIEHSKNAKNMQLSNVESVAIEEYF